MSTSNIVSIITIPLGFYLLMFSADKFIDGASALAKNLGVSALIIGLTIVGFATSAPEMLISALASLDGQGGLAIGNAIGSNVTNIALVLGFSALLVPFSGSLQSIKIDLPVLFLCLILMFFLMRDGNLSTGDGIILSVSLLLVFASMVIRGIKQPKSKQSQELVADIPQEMRNPTAIFWLIFGLLLLLASSKVLVWASVNIAQMLGVSDLIIGLTIVALGTSLPELAATFSSVKKGEPDLAIGNILGSNIFNALGVVGIAALVSPMSVDKNILARDMPIMIGVTILFAVLSVSFKHKKLYLSRSSGAILCASYCAYLAYLAIDSFS